MAKQLLLVRHAEAVLNSSDFGRPLTEKGNADAWLMAHKLNEKFIPEHVICSPAARTLATATYFAAAWQLQQQQLHTNAQVYEALFPQLLQVLCQLDNQFNKVALFGHNPSLSQLVSYLTSQNYQLATCSAILLSFEIANWQQVSAASAQVVFYAQV